MTSAAPSDSTELLALQQQVARLEALLEASRQIHATIRLEDVLHSVLQAVVRELEMPGALFTEPRLSVGSLPCEPWEDCERYPLLDKQGRLLTTLVVARPEGQPLSLYEQDFLESLAVQAAAAVENARHHEQSLSWVRLQRELEAARAIQRSLLPRQMPEIPGYQLAFESKTCHEVGGDYLDVFTAPSGQQVMIVADVAGKGLASAIVAMSFRSAFRAIAASPIPLGELASRLNNLHWGEGEEAQRRYVTAVIARLDPAAHRLEIVSAGHPPAILDDGSGEPKLIAATFPPLGLIPSLPYMSEFHTMTPGSRLLLYTDGMTEVFDSAGEQFGESRLLNQFLQSRGVPCTAVLDQIWDAVAAFRGPAEQHDDMTVLSLHRSGDGGLERLP